MEENRCYLWHPRWHSFRHLPLPCLGYPFGLVGIVVAIIWHGHVLIPIMGTALVQKIAVYALVLWSAFQGIRLLQASNLTAKEKRISRRVSKARKRSR